MPPILPEATSSVSPSPPTQIAAQLPRAKVAGAAAAARKPLVVRRGAPKRVRSAWWAFAPAWARKLVWTWLQRSLVIALIVGAFMRAGWVAPFLGTLESVARASEASSLAVGAIATAGANVTVSFAQFTVDAVGSSMTLSEELWKGIDLRRVNVTRTIGRVAAPESGLLEEWILEDGNGLVPPDLAPYMAPAIHNLSLARPFAETSREYFSSDGVWRAWSIAARALPSGYVGAVVTIVTAEFEVEWANPVWHALGVDPHREAERISASVRRVVANLEAPPASALEITDAALGASALPVLQRPADPQPQYGSWVLALAIVVASWVHRPRNPVDAPEDEDLQP